MNEDGETRRSYGRNAGCSGLGLVLILGLLLSIFGAALGAGFSVRLPFTSANLSIAGSVGHKNIAPMTAPEYVQGMLGDNQQFINLSQSLTIGPAEGIQLFIIGEQPGAPPIDLRISLQRPQ